MWASWALVEEETEEHEGSHEGHESHEEHDNGISGQNHIRLPSPQTTEAEQVITRIIGCAIAVHRAPGRGFLESIYRKAIDIGGARG